MEFRDPHFHHTLGEIRLGPTLLRILTCVSDECAGNISGVVTQMNSSFLQVFIREMYLLIECKAKEFFSVVMGEVTLDNGSKISKPYTHKRLQDGGVKRESTFFFSFLNQPPKWRLSICPNPIEPELADEVALMVVEELSSPQQQSPLI